MQNKTSSRTSNRRETLIPPCLLRLSGEGDLALFPHTGGWLGAAEVNPKGDGILLARSARSNKAICGQLRVLDEVVAKHNLNPRLVLAMVGSGRSTLGPHTARIEQEIEAGWCRWLAMTDTTRVGRDGAPALDFLNNLSRAGTALYLAHLGRPVDWQQDRLLLELFTSLDQFGSEQVARRMRAGKEAAARKRTSQSGK